MSEWMRCRRTLELPIYESVFVCQKWMSYSNNQAYLDGNLRFCENELKVSDTEGKMVVDTLKLHHDTVLKTLKKNTDPSTHTQIWVNVIQILVQFLAFAKSADFNSKLICDSWVRSNFNFNLI